MHTAELLYCQIDLTKAHILICNVVGLLIPLEGRATLCVFHPSGKFSATTPTLYSRIWMSMHRCEDVSIQHFSLLNKTKTNTEIFSKKVSCNKKRCSKYRFHDYYLSAAINLLTLYCSVEQNKNNERNKQ